MTIIQGRLLSPDGTPIIGASIQASLEDYAVESAGIEIYPAGVNVSTTSSTGSDGKVSMLNGSSLLPGAWELKVWATSNSITPIKYVFLIQLADGSLPKSYTLEVPNQTSILFSDLVAGLNNTMLTDALEDVEPAKYNFNIYKYASFNRVLYYQDAQLNPINLNGWTAKLQARTNYNTVLNLSTANGKIILGGDGSIRIKLSSNDTALLDVGTYDYDLVLYADADTTLRFIEGKVTIIEGVTR